MNMEALRDNKDFFNLLVNALDHMIFVIDRNFNIIEYNDILFEGFKMNEDRVKMKLGNALECSKSHEARTVCGRGFFCQECPLRTSFTRVIENKEVIEQLPVTKDFYIEDKKVEKCLLVSARHTYFKGEDVAIVLLHDVTPLAKSMIKLEEMATKDYLTGIYNRRCLFNELKFLAASAKRYKTGFSLLVLDIDNFKQINDTLGHQAGDSVLQRVASFLKNSIRECDILGRHGGDEFIVILPHLDEKGAGLCAERLRKEVEKADFNIPLPLTVSIGAAEYKESMDVDDLIFKADNLLYKAKEEGRNRTKI